MREGARLLYACVRKAQSAWVWCIAEVSEIPLENAPNVRIVVLRNPRPATDVGHYRYLIRMVHRTYSTVVYSTVDTTLAGICAGIPYTYNTVSSWRCPCE